MTNPAKATPIGQPITDASPVDSIAFQPGTDFLATGNGDGTTQLWNLNVDQAINRICATTGNDLTRQQWAIYVRQLPYAPLLPSGIADLIGACFKHNAADPGGNGRQSIDSCWDVERSLLLRARRNRSSSGYKSRRQWRTECNFQWLSVVK